MHAVNLTAHNQPLPNSWRRRDLEGIAIQINNENFAELNAKGIL